MICSIGRVMRGVGRMRRPGSWPRWSGRSMGSAGWGCSTLPSGVSSGGCASAHAASAPWLVAPRRRGRRTAEMVRRPRDEAGWSALLLGAVVGLWGWRLELALAGLLLLIGWLLGRVVRGGAAGGRFFGLAVPLLGGG